MGRFQEGPDGVGLSPHIQHLRPHHRGMARAVALGNYRPTDLADQFHMTQGRLVAFKDHLPSGREVERLRNEFDLTIGHDLAKDLKCMQETALEILDEDLNASPLNMEMRRLRNTTALEVLGMTGIRRTGGNTTLIKIDNTIAQKEIEDLSEDEIRDELIELTQESNGAYS